MRDLKALSQKCNQNGSQERSSSVGGYRVKIGAAVMASLCVMRGLNALSEKKEPERPYRRGAHLVAVG